DGSRGNRLTDRGDAAAARGQAGSFLPGPSQATAAGLRRDDAAARGPTGFPLRATGLVRTQGALRVLVPVQLVHARLPRFLGGLDGRFARFRSLRPLEGVDRLLL